MIGARGTRRRASRRATPRRTRGAPGADLVGALAYLTLVSLFGGEIVDWNLPTIFLLPVTVVFATFVAWRGGFAALAEAPPAGRIALAGIAALPLLQLAPLPPAIWRALPGQELRAATLGLMGVGESWQPMTLEPVGTAICAVFAAGFVAFVGLLLRLDDAAFRRILVATFAFVALDMAVGLLQVVSDGQIGNFFNVQMGPTLLGFFANKNHVALAIASAILLFGLVLVRDLPGSSRRAPAIGFTLFALVCLVATNSRAGLGFGVLAAAAVLADAARRIRLRWRLALLAALALAALAVVSSPAFETVFGRVHEVSDDLRWRFSVWSLPLAGRYLPLGSGLESFKTLYQTHERLGWLIPTYVNAVHDDYIQLVIEAGLPGAAILLLLVLSLVGPAAALPGMAWTDPRRRERIFGLATIALFAAHSVIDYPLRRPAAWIIFAVAVAAVYRRAARDVSVVAERRPAAEAA